jgi:hypothetical protein
LDRNIINVKRAYEEQLLRLPGVVGVGIGMEGIRVYVKSRAFLEMKQVTIPEKLEGYPVKIVESGELHAFQNTSKWRPISGGLSIGQPWWGTGTLSTLVIERNSGKKLLLSNNHVFAKSNNNEFQWAKAGDSIIQPGHVDGGREGLPPLETVGHLLRWVNLQTAHWVGDHFEGEDNYVDCALAEPLDPNVISSDISGIGSVAGITEPSLNLNVQKSGRTTRLTQGVITDIDFTGIIDYGVLWAKFVNQIIVQGTEGIEKPFSRPGDSGSLIVDLSNNAVGLLFAGNDETNITVCNRIIDVLNALNVDVPVIPPATQILEKLVPVAWLEIMTTPIAGPIFLDNMYVGTGRFRTIVAAELEHVITCGGVPGYITPKPFKITLKEGEDTTLTIIYQTAAPPISMFPILLGVAIIGAILYIIGGRGR